jgi:hypothetical protein
MWKWNVWVWAEDEGKELCGMQPTEQKDAWNGWRSGGLLSASPAGQRQEGGSASSVGCERAKRIHLQSSRLPSSDGASRNITM